MAQHVTDWNAAHGANVVVYYELWNEPNGSFFLGTYAQLAQMSRVIGPAIKSINSAALISSPANQGRYGYQGLDQFFSAGGICDFIAFHGYLWHVNGVLIWPDDPTWGIGDFVNRIRHVEALHGLNLPLWDTEHSFASVTADLTSKTEQANFLARFYLTEWQTGVKASVWYGWDFYPNGTMWQSGTTWPDGIAAGTVYSWMTGATPQPIVTSGSVLSMKLGLANGASTKAVWTRSGTASISTAGFSQYSDLNGNVRAITGSSISVSGSPILLISSATATSVSVSPSDPTIAAGGTQQFAATAYYSNGESGPVQASWKSSDPGVATISGSGLCTGAAAGITTLSATYMGLTASTSVIITAAGSGAAPPLPNPGFEQGALYWAFNNSGSYSIVSGSAHSGNSYAVLNAPVGTHPVLFATGANGDQYFPVAAGDVIRFGGWLSRASGDGQGRYKLAVYDASRANPVYIDPTPSNVTGSSWTQQTGTYTVASGKSFVRIYCELFSNTVAASVAFDDVILTRSAAAP